MNTTQLQVDIDGMSCGSCVAHVRSALATLPGVHVDDVRIGRAVVTGPSSLSEASIRDALAAAGYTLTSIGPAREDARETARVAPRAAPQAAPHAGGGCCCSGGAGHTTSHASPQLARRRPR